MTNSLCCIFVLGGGFKTYFGGGLGLGEVSFFQRGFGMFFFFFLGGSVFFPRGTIIITYFPDGML